MTVDASGSSKKNWLWPCASTKKQAVQSTNTSHAHAHPMMSELVLEDRLVHIYVMRHVGHER